MNLYKIDNFIISKIKQQLKDLIKFKLADEIVKIYPYIEYIIINTINELKIKYEIQESESEIIEHVWKNIKINGFNLEFWETNWQNCKEVNELTDYKTLYNLCRKNNLFRKKQVKVNIQGLELNINVLDTGKKYIPTDEILITQELINALDELKEKERIEQLANILEEGFESIPLTMEERRKVDIEVSKRIKEKLFAAKKKLDDFDYDTNKNYDEDLSTDELRKRLFDTIEEFDELEQRIR